MTGRIVATAIAGALLLSSPASAYRECDGILTSNNVCIGSESNVDSRDNHEPIETDRRDYIRPDDRRDADRYRYEHGARPSDLPIARRRRQ